MLNEKTLLLNKQQTLQKIKRIAYEIYEDNFDETEIILAGIVDRGYIFAQHLKQDLEAISGFKIKLIKIELDKLSPLQSEIKLDSSTEELEGKTVIMTDDVLNTGRTFAYSLKPFLTANIAKLQTAVIVDRGHKNFPISADYTGYALSTTLQEHIEVVLDIQNDKMGVYLS